MKKIILLSCVLIASVTAFSQDFKPFRVGLGAGFASPQGDGAKGGVLLYLEPSYRVSDAIAIGLKAKIAVMARGASVTVGNTVTSAEGSVSGAGSYTLNGQYYFSNNTFRPFVGAGFGIYSLASASFSSTTTGSSTTSNNSDAVSGGTKFGFYPRVGFDAGHFTFNIEYNIIPKSTNSYSYSSGQSTVVANSESKNSYLGIRVGAFIGGGKR